MTMIFTHQSSAIHPFEQSAYVRGGAFSDAVAAQKKSPAPLQYRAPIDLAERRSSKSALQESSIIMPCPKKVSVLCPNALLGGGSPLTSPVMTSPLRPIFPIIIEDSQEEIHHPIDFVESDEDSFFEQAACAELMEIMSNGSSRSSSKSSSPQPSFQESLPAEATIPFTLEEHAFLGTSPIVRANNPLPNDQSFSPDTSEAAAPVIPQLFQSFLARHRHQAKVFDFNLNVDEAGETQAPYRSKLTRVF